MLYYNHYHLLKENVFMIDFTLSQAEKNLLASLEKCTSEIAILCNQYKKEPDPMKRKKYRTQMREWEKKYVDLLDELDSLS